jgi:hypothetical protein
VNYFRIGNVFSLRYSTAITSTATPSFCLGEPTMMPST